MSNQEIVKKITFRSIAGVPAQSDLRDAVKNDSTDLPQKMAVVGFAKRVKTTVHPDTGETYDALEGEFAAYSPSAPDNQFVSGTLYLPRIAMDLLRGRLVDGESIEFALMIGVRLPRDGEKTPTGYVYTVSPLIQPTKSTPLQALIDQSIGLTPKQ